MTFDISYSREAAKELADLDRAVQIQILKKIIQLQKQPEMGKPLSNVLKSKRSLHIGKYRVVYIIDKQEIIIARIGHRKDVYE